jgi:hypothetical protein
MGCRRRGHLCNSSKYANNGIGQGGLGREAPESGGALPYSAGASAQRSMSRS